MAKEILKDPLEIPAVMTGNRYPGASRRDPDSQIMIPRRMSIEELSFAAHVDYGQNSGFIEEVGAKVVILVHGEQNNMGRLKSALLSKNQEKALERRAKIYNPRNCEELRIPFRGVKIAKVHPSCSSLSTISGKLTHCSRSLDTSLQNLLHSLRILLPPP